MVNVSDDVLLVDLVYENVPPTCTLCGLLGHEKRDCCSNKENSDESHGRSVEPTIVNVSADFSKEVECAPDTMGKNNIPETTIEVADMNGINLVVDLSQAQATEHIDSATDAVAGTSGSNRIDNNLYIITSLHTAKAARDMENHPGSHHVSSVEHSPKNDEGEFEPVLSTSMHKKIKAASKKTGARRNQILTRGRVMNHVS
ncbi:hypothetical protein LWI29_007582 [Acer saccharum]|uniref:CCHC-type domain-containing protein n=1 Tax=Acer saccharum TaxID=4024 RepID=A0AA39SR35_ACESA|nr:hypothetical protein LWI29_007582 [Acer saccharum]